MTKSLLKASDSEKLKVLALWFDQRDDARGHAGERTVQADLRRISERIELLEVLGVW